ncbi:MAG: hypothetical protein LKJ17_09365 [Oscillospiraceae bacterium]|nr:hypothetical protein [Oscillospiraceae bacterium]
MSSTIKETKKGIMETTVSSAAQNIDEGVTELEMAFDMFQVILEAAESEFGKVHPESAVEELTLKRLKMYYSAASIFQTSILEALPELQAGRDCLYEAIRKGGASV